MSENNSYRFFRPEFYNPQDDEATNRLIKGENLITMNLLLDSGYKDKIDLIYIDPPFLSKSKYGFRKRYGEITIDRPGYDDNWSNGIDEYLEMIHERLVLMRQLLANSGVICFHADWRIIHYVKVMMDKIFGYDSFVNEIIWTYTGGSDRVRGFARKHDTILVYSKTKDFKFNPVFVDFSESTKQRFNKIDSEGRRYKENKLSDGRRTKTYMKEEGKLCPDYWHFNIIVSSHSEATGYRTQKPKALLQRLIEAFTDPGDIVADFFAGSGTTAEAAENVGRNWIAVEKANSAISAARFRMIVAESAFCDEFIVPQKVFEDDVVHTITDIEEPIEYNRLYAIKGELLNQMMCDIEEESGDGVYLLYFSHPGQIVDRDMLRRLEIAADKHKAKVFAPHYDFGLFPSNRMTYMLSPDTEEHSKLSRILIEGNIIKAPVVEFNLSSRDGRYCIYLTRYQYEDYPTDLAAGTSVKLTGMNAENPLSIMKYWAVDPCFDGNIFKARYVRTMSSPGQPPEDYITIDDYNIGNIAIITEDIFGIQMRHILQR